jgi:hypothetical protein
MNIFLTVFIALVFCSSLCGCELLCQAGTGTCGMSREDARRLLNPKPYGTRWIKENGTDEQRLLDIKECGGGIGLHVGFTKSQEEAERREGETSLFPASERLYRAWSQCMKDRGYRYVYQ